MPYFKPHLHIAQFMGVMCVMTVVVLVNKGFAWLEGSTEYTLAPLPRQLSVIVPTYKEKDNLVKLTERVFAGN